MHLNHLLIAVVCYHSGCFKQPMMISAYSAIIDPTATRIRYSILCSFDGLSKPTTDFVLHVPWLLLCKNCSCGKRRCFASSQDQVRNWQRKNSATVQRR